MRFHTSLVCWMSLTNSYQQILVSLKLTDDGGEIEVVSDNSKIPPDFGLTRARIWDLLDIGISFYQRTDYSVAVSSIPYHVLPSKAHRAQLNITLNSSSAAQHTRNYGYNFTL